jgi:hypothetical protein
VKFTPAQRPARHKPAGRGGAAGSRIAVLFMPYHVSLDSRAGYLHARATGAYNPRNAMRFLVDACEAAQAACQKDLLLEFAQTGPSFDGGLIHEIVTARAAGATGFRRIAYVDESSERGLEPMLFAETIARNRGVNVRLFRVLAHARAWLAAPAEALAAEHS